MWPENLGAGQGEDGWGLRSPSCTQNRDTFTPPPPGCVECAGGNFTVKTSQKGGGPCVSVSRVMNISPRTLSSTRQFSPHVCHKWQNAGETIVTFSTYLYKNNSQTPVPFENWLCPSQSRGNTSSAVFTGQQRKSLSMSEPERKSDLYPLLILWYFALINSVFQSLRIVMVSSAA